MKAFVVAGASTGVGKTTVTAALAAALCRTGNTVQLFKCGPDYIDTAHHAALSGRPSYNLDTWMMAGETNRSIFWNAVRDADVAIVEGVMGLFDGVSGSSDEGSTAEIARLLELPVVLVVDASNAARSVAALVAGFRDFDPQVNLLGVILNGAAGPPHVKLLRDAIAPTGVRVLGWLPKLPDITLPERHLGLVTAAEKTWTAAQCGLLADAVLKHVNLELLLNASELPQNSPAISQPETPAQPMARIGIARDQAFSFYYQSSLDQLRVAGAELVDVSPLADAALPRDLDGLYFGGGYPELFAEQLGDNRAFLQSLHDYVASERLVYAECGGLMYLAETLTSRDGQCHPMAAVLPLAVEMLDHLDRFGYTEVELLQDCLIGGRNTHLRGHSFHYSRVSGTNRLQRQYRAQQVLTGEPYEEGYAAGNVLASYIHLSFAAAPEAASRFVQSCVQRRMVAQ